MDNSITKIQENIECVICLEIMITSIEFICHHSICITCYQQLLSQPNKITCPLCRIVIEPKMEIQEHEDTTIFSSFDATILRYCTITAIGSAFIGTFLCCICR